VSGERILVVDDEPQIRRAVRTALVGHGYIVDVAEDGEQALAQLGAHVADALVLDLVLPGMDGLEVLRDVRRWSRIPVIVLSARGQEQDKVRALDCGADDYLTKPFGLDELLARVRAVMRRQPAVDLGIVTVGDVTIDFDKRLVRKGGLEVHLTPTEFDLLRVLSADADRVLTHRQLLERTWGAHAADNAQQLRVYINYLRRKLEDDPARPRLIVTDPGVGYRLRVAE
jgi:two-component system KDP operon response regulator KdpE